MYSIPTRIKDNPMWCVSKDKTPLDLFALKKGYQWGASFKRSHSAYDTYDKASEIGAAHNLPVTLFVDSEKMSIIMIDIEKTCPLALRQGILHSLKDNIVYMEKSLSGKGFHLMINLNESIALHTLKYKQWFEILTNHHCTFTKQPISYDEAYNAIIDTNEKLDCDENDETLIKALAYKMTGVEFYSQLGEVRDFKTFESTDFDTYKKAAATFDGRHADLFGMLCDMSYDKTVDMDFKNDYSRYEFGYASKLHYKLKQLCVSMIDADCNYYSMELSKEQSIMLVYMVLKQKLPPRAKHNEVRNGLPWLLFTSQQVYLKSFGEDK
jgi:hypothetical protein